MTTKDQLLKAELLAEANIIGKRALHMKRDLERERVEIEDHLSDVCAQIAATRLLYERSLEFKYIAGSEGPCPQCWAHSQKKALWFRWRATIRKGIALSVPYAVSS